MFLSGDFFVSKDEFFQGNQKKKSPNRTSKQTVVVNCSTTTFIEAENLRLKTLGFGERNLVQTPWVEGLGGNSFFQIPFSSKPTQPSSNF